MSVFEIEGGVPLRGTVRASGNKNAILPMIAAAMLTDQEVVLEVAEKVRMKFTRFQRSVSDKVDLKAGIRVPGKPLVIHSNNCASVCAPGMACCIRFAGRGFMVMPTGPSPLPDAPWHGTQLTA